ncbi:MAG: CocE/NonD family hydrolase [Pseudomonadota bacterium]
MGVWLDNLIPLKAPALDPAHQYAGWQPAPPARSGLGCHLLADQRIPVEGGVTLSADVYTPKTPGRYPAIVQFAAYSRELHTAGIPTGSNEIGAPPVFTNHGYGQVVVMRRGMGRSGGEGRVFLNDQDVDDHAACIAWAAAQPWCDGRVVLFGTSYYGMTQPLVAVRRPPALKAFFCNEICTDYFRHLTQFGGVPGLYFFNLWMGANFTEAMFRLRVPPVLRALLSHITNSGLKRIWQPSLMKRADRLFSTFMRQTPVRAVREWYVNWLIDGKTRAASSIPPGPAGQLRNIDIPFVVAQNLGYFNLHQFGCYDLFENAGTASGRKWMILAPAHYELPVYAWQMEAVAFFDHILHGIENGYREQPAVRYWLDGAERYEGATDFPVPQSRPLRLHLAAAGPDSATHHLQMEVPETASPSWVGVPPGAVLVGGFDDVANQMLTFEMTVDRPLHLAGPVSLSLRLSCNDIDTQVVARLSRVARDGTAKLLSLGTIAAARRTHDPARSTACEIAIDTQTPQPLTPGHPVDLAFSLTPAPTLVQPGERLRLDIASRLDLLRSNVSKGYVQFDIPAPPYFSRNSLHLGEDTFLEVHVVAPDAGAH